MGDTNSIEIRAVSKINELLSYCNHLLPYISQQEKTRNVDGSVCVYKTPDKNEQSYVGKATVQVKGLTKKATELLKDKINYSVSKIKLNSHLTDGGIIYFVIYFNGMDYSIYYVSLLPYDLLKLLSEKNSKASCSISLKKFPIENIAEMTNIFLTFIQEQKNQQHQNKLINLDDLRNNGTPIERLKFNVSGININRTNLTDYMISKDIYLYAQIKGINDYLIPIDKVTVAEISHTIDCEIKVNETTYYNNYIVKRSKNKYTLVIGNSFFLSISDNNTNIKYSISGNLTNRILDVEFLIDLFESNTLQIGKQLLKKLFSESVTDEIRKLKSILKDLSEIKSLFDFFGVNKSFDIAKVTEDEWQTLRTLIDAVLYNNPIKFNNIDTESQLIYTCVKISNISIMLIYEYIGNELYKVRNFCKPFQAFVSPIDDPKRKISVSQYILLNNENFVNADNLNYDVIYESITSIEPSTDYYSEVNQTILEIIKAYDKNNNPDLLNLASKLCLWLRKHDTGIEKEIVDINYYQTIKRNRNLTTKEIVELAYLNDTSSNDLFLCGINILLNDNEKVEEHFSRLDKTDQERFREFPIYYLYERKKEIK